MGRNLMTFDSEDWLIEFSEDQSEFTELDGVSGFTINPEAGTSRTVRTLRGTTNVEQRGGPGQASFDIGNFLPHLQSWKDFRQLFTDASVFTVRTTSRAEEELLGEDATRLVAIDTDGVATFSGSAVIDYQEDYAKGHVLTIGNDTYVVEKINSATEVMVSPAPAAAVAAAQFTVKVPRIQRSVRCKILDMNTDNLAEGAQLANAVTVSLRTIPGNWDVV